MILLLILLSRFVIPNPEFKSPTSTILEDSTGVLIGARIANDGQWRFPAMEEVPEKFEKCILLFEDQYFYAHPGINPFSIYRAIKVNAKAGKIRQGGSTLTMQVARMLRENKSRTMSQKLIELFWTLHLEINYSKSEILNLYASNAPFGGNVVGLDAAAWRYYNRSADDLSWAEMAALAVLPNAPALIYPGKNSEILRAKRDRLLKKLQKEGYLTEENLELALLESLPGKPYPLPQYANHLLDRAFEQKNGERVQTDISAHLQKSAQNVLNSYVKQYQYNDIYNGAILILEPKTGRIVAYVGNATTAKKHGNDVDVIKAPRSTGSLLKPFLYATMLSQGELLPKMLVADIPTYFSGYSPKNFYMTFDGAVPADEALSRSLNVPFVRLLKQHGVDRFYNDLTAMGMRSLVYNSDHYGLSLILGGAEGKLIEMTSMYAGMVRRLQHYNKTGTYSRSNMYLSSHFKQIPNKEEVGADRLSAAAIYETFEALTEVNRPISRTGWKSFGSSRKIAWKTGTSFGNKDAWAIGVTPNYVVGVWIGNADGEGRASLTGSGYAAPVMFDVFDHLKDTVWFEQPVSDYQETRVCAISGHKASQDCDLVDTVLIPNVIQNTKVCPYHIKVHVDMQEQYRVNMNCESADRILHKSWFVLPPVQEWFYKIKSPLYKPLPPIRPDCEAADDHLMDFIYPKFPNKIFIPKELSGQKGRAVFELVHRHPKLKVYWHLDGNYIGVTQDFHQLEIIASAGTHVLVVVDENGNELVKKFEVLE
ncbi:penicillin-binding protein 1C [bacterium SCSIO 12643]|nr:penicillin-binding protein 1C [bacterium SCSIO 12643]